MFIAANHRHAQVALITRATHDALTGLPNRQLLFDRLNQAISMARCTKTDTALMFVDLDGFKRVNDVRGHDAGDALLREVADRLQRAIRPMDTVARIGGDEFVVLAPAVGGAAGARVVAARIAAALEAPVKIAKATVSVTASIGISLLDAHQAGEDPSPDLLLQRADTAMYHAKSLGGSQTHVFDPVETAAMSQDERNADRTNSAGYDRRGRADGQSAARPGRQLRAGVSLCGVCIS